MVVEEEVEVVEGGRLVRLMILEDLSARAADEKKFGCMHGLFHWRFGYAWDLCSL